MSKSYRPWLPDHRYLLPPDPRDWLPKDHLAHFVLEVVGVLDVSAIEAPIQNRDPRGERPYAPRMMLALLVYAYCTGVFSSRKMERRTYEDIAVRYIAGGQHPEFSTICAFRAWCEEQRVDAYISTQRQRRSTEAGTIAPVEPPITPQQKMRAKVASPEGQKIYRRRKCIPEPVFGQIKQAMGFRRFSMRGMAKVQGEWALVTTCHNIRKLWVARQADRLPTIA